MSVELILKTLEFRHLKKEEEKGERFLRSSSRILELCMEFVVKCCDIERVFLKAKQEEILIK